jgi:hypothetical protein
VLRLDLMINTYTITEPGSLARAGPAHFSSVLLAFSQLWANYDLMRNAASRLLDWAFVINPDKLVLSSRIL